MLRTIYLIAMVMCVGVACKKTKVNAPPVIVFPFPENVATPGYNQVSISTDKAAYLPGEDVFFTINLGTLPGNVKVRYKYLNNVLSESVITSSTWSWRPPAVDFRGYYAEVYAVNMGVETIYAVIGVDVSSDWTRFPRYGFLSKFPQLSDVAINEVIGNLNRYHINGLQFYDWHNKHHKPLPLSGAAPAPSWKDISNRDISFSTVQRYITSAHNRNIKAMFYNLIYGAWNNAEADGVSQEWFIYTDASHTNKDFHPLPSPPFLSNLYLLDPSNTSWQQYLLAENRKVYSALAFDGFHIDQLGDRGLRFKYDGSVISLADTYKPFIDAMKADAPQKNLVMNAVAQYGQPNIAQSAADFLYTEVWKPFESYSDLANIIQQNNLLSHSTKNTVLAAYMNYDLANNPGYFNTPGVLMTNAVIFAFGGAHMELGEHMLGKEYFPNNNLAMKEELKSSLVNYYDFLVAYQNLLRDGGTFENVSISSGDNQMNIAPWPASNGSVAAFKKKRGNEDIIHLLNFNNSTTQNWSDNKASQVAPALIENAKLILTSSKTVKKMWVASPDIIGGASRAMNFIQTGDKVAFILPQLRYWDMIVLEY